MLPFLPCTNVTLLKLGGAGASKRTGPATKRGKGEEKNRKEGSVVSDFVSETLLQPGTELIKYKGGGGAIFTGSEHWSIWARIVAQWLKCSAQSLLPSAQGDGK